MAYHGIEKWQVVNKFFDILDVPLDIGLVYDGVL